MSNIAAVRHVLGRGNISSAFSLLAGSGLLGYVNKVGPSFNINISIDDEPKK